MIARSIFFLLFQCYKNTQKEDSDLVQTINTNKPRLSNFGEDEEGILLAKANMDRKRTTVSRERFLDVVFPSIHVLLIRDLDVKLLYQRAHDHPHLCHSDILARANHGACREGNEEVAAGDHLVGGDGISRRQFVLLLWQPTVRPESVCEWIEVCGVAMDCVSPD